MPSAFTGWPRLRWRSRKRRERRSGTSSRPSWPPEVSLSRDGFQACARQSLRFITTLASQPPKRPMTTAVRDISSVMLVLPRPWLLLLPLVRPSSRRVLVQRSQEHRAERGLFADGAAACGLLHVAWDATQQVDSGRRHAGKYVTRHETPSSR